MDRYFAILAQTSLDRAPNNYISYICRENYVRSRGSDNVCNFLRRSEYTRVLNRDRSILQVAAVVSQEKVRNIILNTTVSWLVVIRCDPEKYSSLQIRSQVEPTVLWKFSRQRTKRNWETSVIHTCLRMYNMLAIISNPRWVVPRDLRSGLVEWLARLEWYPAEQRWCWTAIRFH